MKGARKDHLDALAVAVLLSCCAIWGLAQVAAKVTLTEVPPLLQSGARSLGAALLLLLWSRWRGLSVLRREGSGAAGLLAGSTTKAGLAAGVLFAAEFACMFIGLQFTTASRMVVFLYTAPFVVALGMPLIARNERLTGLQSGGLVLAFGGVVWAFAEGFSNPAAGRLQWLGDALGIAAAVLWGATTLLVRGTRLATALPEKTLLYQLAVSAVALLAASAVSSEVWPRVLQRSHQRHSHGPGKFYRRNILAQQLAILSRQFLEPASHRFVARSRRIERGANLLAEAHLPNPCRYVPKLGHIVKRWLKLCPHAKPPAPSPSRCVPD